MPALVARQDEHGMACSYLHGGQLAGDDRPQEAGQPAFAAAAAHSTQLTVPLQATMCGTMWAARRRRGCEASWCRRVRGLGGATRLLHHGVPRVSRTACPGQRCLPSVSPIAPCRQVPARRRDQRGCATDSHLHRLPCGSRVDSATERSGSSGRARLIAQMPAVACAAAVSANPCSSCPAYKTGTENKCRNRFCGRNRSGQCR